MKNSYPDNPVTPYTGPDSMSLMQINLLGLKQMAERQGVQIELTIKPEGFRTTVIKKSKDKSVRKRQFDCENGELTNLYTKLVFAIQEVSMLSM